MTLHSLSKAAEICIRLAYGNAEEERTAPQPFRLRWSWTLSRRFFTGMTAVGSVS